MRGMHVLVVDGSPTGRSILAGMLEDLGCRATCVASQDGARESLSRSEEARDVPSLILADGERKLAVVEPGPAGRRWEERQVCGYLVKPVWRTDLMHALLKHGGASPTPDLARASLAPNPDPVDRGGPRILLAEDNPVNQLVAVSILKKRGHRVQVANNGLEALALAKSERFRVILMDLQMPEMNGLEAVRAIREYEAPSGNYTPVIALTANATASDREKCLAAGMIGHLSKPIIPEKLFEAIEAICGANG